MWLASERRMEARADLGTLVTTPVTWVLVIGIAVGIAFAVVALGLRSRWAEVRRRLPTSEATYWPYGLLGPLSKLPTA